MYVYSMLNECSSLYFALFIYLFILKCLPDDSMKKEKLKYIYTHVCMENDNNNINITYIQNVIVGGRNKQQIKQGAIVEMQ